ncbi:hypothetical protein DBR43_04655 [Pedobacter sp. KBW06]|uniref:DoxX family protein n=1 Tax=Pedobacter sp. KBW06 TaxID=2153359 RepID=UPI000F5B359C|nr:hypothetical protein [Pedobacter sp. KBW06]RQO74680.1 hypothetical protein DBR43_04655 [Pedobacter sp. KBW06]
MKNVQTSLIQNVMRLVLGFLMIFAAFGHFTYQRTDFQAQVPDWIPLSKDLVVILSGVFEVLLGLGMVFLTNQKLRIGLALATFFLLIFPGNIAQYLNGTDAFGLNSDKLRLIRLFFQPLLIIWALWSTGVFRYLRERKRG